MKSQNWINIKFTDFERTAVLQRLTAVWAFVESGLGGVLHALQVPFTGLIVGGIAMLIITLIATVSLSFFQDLFKAFIIVVIVKLTLSPYTPITAYVAIFFQTLLGYLIYSFFNIQFLSIGFFCCLAMLESAIQKILLLIFFYGKNLYIAIDEFFNFILKQFSLQKIEASFWIMMIYIIIYLFGGVLISVATHRIIFSPIKHHEFIKIQTKQILQKKKKKNRVLVYFIFAVLIATCLFLFGNQDSTSFKILNSLFLSLSIILFWYFILTPFITKYLMKILSTKEFEYKGDIQNILNFFPTLQNIIKQSWLISNSDKGLQRIFIFASTLFSWVLLHNHQKVIDPEC